MQVEEVGNSMTKSNQIEESLFLRACRGQKCAQTPMWLMRQAGRYLPEYRNLRQKHKMLEMFRTPEIAAEVTLQPIRRYAFDAAIIFADILTPLPEMGVTLDFIEGKGPVIENGVSCAKDVERLIVPQKPAGDFTLRALELVAQELQSSNTPLIGFAGGPFTLSTYLMESGLAEKGPKTKLFMSREPKAWDELQNKLVCMLLDYLEAQVAAGANALQIFESWLGVVSPEQYERYVQPYLKKLFVQLKQRVDVPVIFFSTGTSALFPRFVDFPIDVLGVDWRCDLQLANQLAHGKFALQGNLDPHALLGSEDLWTAEVRRIVQQGQSLNGHIFNLGHGILPETSTEVVSRLVELVRSL
jgi:uroporphyrinogen decarboxylase